MTPAERVNRLPDGSVVVDRWGVAWQLEDWESVASGALVRERWWYAVGVREPVNDGGLAAMAPLVVLSRGHRAA